MIITALSLKGLKLYDVFGLRSNYMSSSVFGLRFVDTRNVSVLIRTVLLCLLLQVAAAYMSNVERISVSHAMLSQLATPEVIRATALYNRLAMRQFRNSLNLSQKSADRKPVTEGHIHRCANLFTPVSTKPDESIRGFVECRIEIKFTGVISCQLLWNLPYYPQTTPLLSHREG